MRSRYPLGGGSGSEHAVRLLRDFVLRRSAAAVLLGPPLARQWFDDAEELLKGCLDEPTLPAETLGRVLLLLERVKEVRYRL